MIFVAWASVAFVLLLGPAAAFNLAPEVARVVPGPKGTNFGYSVALWASRNGTGSTRVAVGAPRGTNSTVGKGIVPLGNLHLCEPSAAECPAVTQLPSCTCDDLCDVIGTIEYVLTRNQSIGFGETLLAADAPGSKLVVCAPRYTNRYVEEAKSRGACYVLDDKDYKNNNKKKSKRNRNKSNGNNFINNISKNTRDLCPFQGNFFNMSKEGKNVTSIKNNQNATGYGMAGYSVAMNEAQSSVYMGAPNAFHGQGTVSGPNKKLTKYWHKEEILDFMNEGWATVVGRFDGQRDFVATSAPNPGREMGKVTFHDAQTLEPLSTPVLVDDVLGAKFGFSLASADFDGDGAADLVVGAPLSPGLQGAPDAGRIYVYSAPLKAEAGHQLQKQPVEVEGAVPWARFGHVVSGLGDINRDGFQDLAVGAPFSEDGGRVYIFNGQRKGLNPVASQVLYASEISNDLRGFGFSVDGGLDMDDNGYPDVVVGAVRSDAVVLIRTAPVLKIEGTLTFDPPQINPNNKSCNITNKLGQTEDVVCFDLVVRLRFSTFKRTAPHPVNVTLVLDPDLERLAFMQNKQTQMTFSTNITTALDEGKTTQKVYMKSRRISSMDRLEAKASVALLPSPVGTRTDGTLVEVPPVLDMLQSAIQGHGNLVCEDPRTCFSRPDLVLSASTPRQNVVLGKDVRIELELLVQKESAYETEIEVTAPAFLGFQSVNGQLEVPDCSSQPNSTILCRFSTKLRKDSKIPLVFAFTYSPLTLVESLSSASLSEVPLGFEVRSDSADFQPSDNALDVSVGFRLDYQVGGLGRSIPDSVNAYEDESVSLHELSSQTSPERVGPQALYTFTLMNNGISPLIHAKMVMQIPLKMNGLTLLRMSDTPATSPPMKCSLPRLNEEGFQSLEKVPSNSSHSAPTDDKGEGQLDQQEVETAANLTRHDSRHLVLSCDNVDCANVACELPMLRNGESAIVTMSGFLVVPILKLTHHSSMRLEATLSIEFPETLNTSASLKRLATFQTHITIFEKPVSNLRLLSWWHLLLIFGMGIIIVLVIMVTLYKCGFFKRKRVPLLPSEDDPKKGAGPEDETSVSESDVLED